MSPPSDRPRRRRTWPQRLVLAVGVLVVLGATTAAAGTAWLGVSFAHIDRVKNIALQAAAKGGPANYLIVGTDGRAGIDPKAPDAQSFLGNGEIGCGCTDTIMVLRVDPNASTAQVLSLPRDLWVTMADNGSHARINSAHQRGEQVLINTIQQSFGITINHYVEIDFVGFERLVDAVGGIKLWFDAPVRDSHTGLSIPNSGCVSLNGLQAREFARSRYIQYRGTDGKWHSDPTADLGRITRQQIFIRQAINKAVSQGLGNPLTLNRLVSAGVNNVRLDSQLGAGDLISLGRKFKSFSASSLTGYTLPSTGFTTAGGADVQLPDMHKAEPILDIFRGLPPGSVTPQAVDVSVLNGSGKVGQAADVGGALVKHRLPRPQRGLLPDGRRPHHRAVRRRRRRHRPHGRPLRHRRRGARAGQPREGGRRRARHRRRLLHPPQPARARRARPTTWPSRRPPRPRRRDRLDGHHRPRDHHHDVPGLRHRPTPARRHLRLRTWLRQPDLAELPGRASVVCWRARPTAAVLRQQVLGRPATPGPHRGASDLHRARPRPQVLRQGLRAQPSSVGAPAIGAQWVWVSSKARELRLRAESVRIGPRRPVIVRQTEPGGPYRRCLRQSLPLG